MIAKIVEDTLLQEKLSTCNLYKSITTTAVSFSPKTTSHRRERAFTPSFYFNSAQSNDKDNLSQNYHGMCRRWKHQITFHNLLANKLGRFLRTKKANIDIKAVKYVNTTITTYLHGRNVKNISFSTVKIVFSTCIRCIQHYMLIPLLL